MDNKKDYRNYKRAFLIPFDFFELDELDEIEDDDLGFIFRFMLQTASQTRTGEEPSLPSCNDKYIKVKLREFLRYNRRAEDNYNIAIEKSRKGGKSKSNTEQAEDEESLDY